MEGLEELNSWAIPLISGLTILVITLWFKDLATSIAKGLMFKLSKSFNEGDKVIIDGEHAVIVKIGMTETVFAINKTEEGSKKIETHWRFVYNERIPFLQLSKIVSEVNE